MTLEPNYLVLIAPGADANDPTPDWVDVSADLRSLEYGRGSPSDLDRNNPGTATVVLDNYAGTYDNENSLSAYFGDLVPNMRVRILAEWFGDLYPAFDGYLDALPLDYPGENEATATLRATDGFKPLAKTALPSSAYVAELAADGPVALWRLNEPSSTVSGSKVYDSIGGRDMTVLDSWASEFGADGIVAREPDDAVEFTDVTDGMRHVGQPPVNAAPMSVEVVFAVTGDGVFFSMASTAQVSGSIPRVYFQVLVGAVLFTVDNGPDTAVTVASGAGFADGAPHHAVGTWDASGNVGLYVDGVSVDTDVGADNVDFAALSGQTVSTIGASNNWPTPGQTAPLGRLQFVAVYDYILGAARVAAHAGAVSTPWNDDTPGARAARVLDVIGWPAELRDLDTGASSLQSATLGTTALEHLQKTAESEFGEFFMSADGVATLRARGNRINRGALATFGDADGEINYREIRFDDSDELIRNPVTISRLEGVAQTAQDDANIARYYPNDYSLDGLYHDDDTLSRDAADFYVSEFKDPKRRVVGLEFGPARDNRRFDLYPLLLQLELGQVYDVVFRPPNADTFTQTVVVEGIRNSWSPDAGHACAIDTSPAFVGTFMELDSLDGDGLGTDGTDGDRLFF